MATTSEIKAGLDEISSAIKASRQRLTSAKENVTTQETNLSALAAKYADIITTVNAFTPTGAFETLAKDELQRLTVEFQQLQAAAASAVSDLEGQTEF